MNGRREQPLPEPHIDHNGNPMVFACPICGAINVGMPPHEEGNPCPLALREKNAAAFFYADFRKMMEKMGLVGGDVQ